MPRPFNKYDWLKIMDLERNPEKPFTQTSVEWFKRDDRRMLLIALDRYATHITAERIWRNYAHYHDNPFGD